MSKSTLNKFLFSSAVVAGVVAVAPQESEAAVGDQVLKQGMSHQDVTELQNILKDKGFFTYHTATGYFGTYTRDAVLDYQKENNLRVDGIAGPETFGALLDKKSSNTETKKETTTQQSNLLRIGSRGENVTNLQDELRSLGFFNQSSTGYYGSITRDAVIAFQKEQGLRLIDGIVGPETRGALNNVDAQPAASETTTTESKPAETKPEETTTETETTTEETSVPTEQASESTSSSMRVGTRGENVTELQQQLRTLGYFNQEPTGYYGEITKNAVMEFQRTNGISVDGIVGSGTQSTLNGSPASASTDSSSSSESTSSNNSSSSSESASSNNSSSSSESTSSNNSSSSSESTSSNNSSSSSNESTASESSNAAAPAPSTNNNAAPATNTNTSNTSTASSSNVVSGLISSAQSVIGVPYPWGGTTTAGFDCSGMIQYIFRQNGIEVPRTAAAQWNAGTSVSSPSVGDIVFFETYAAGPTHNGIYIGDNKFIHTGSSRGVEVSDLNNVYWGPRYLGAKRLH